jgi:hypothetical protein
MASSFGSTLRGFGVPCKCGIRNFSAPYSNPHTFASMACWRKNRGERTSGDHACAAASPRNHSESSASYVGRTNEITTNAVDGTFLPDAIAGENFHSFTANRAFSVNVSIPTNVSIPLTSPVSSIRTAKTPHLLRLRRSLDTQNRELRAGVPKTAGQARAWQ